MKLIWAAWAAFFAVFYVSHLRVKRAGGVRPENRVRTDSASHRGLALQFLSMVVALAWPGAERPDMIWPAVSVAIIAIWFTATALLHLGRQWRVAAAVTDDHQLITTGPYRIVRHPIYLAFLLMVAATVMIRAPWPGVLLALGLFVLGTEIRVRAEDRLLAAAFPREFPGFVQSVSAYLPGLR